MSLRLEDRDRDRESVSRDLVSGDEEVRRLAVQRACELPADESIRRLVECLGDPSWRVRKAAVERLVALPEADRAIEALIGALADGENPGRRNSAVEALVGRSSESVPRLIETLESDDVDVRKLAVDALAGIEDPAARDAMAARLRDPDPNVRAAAADAFGILGGEAAPQRLLSIANSADEDALVRFSALRSLACLEVTVSAGDLSGALDEATLRAAAYGVLGRVDDDVSRGCLLKALTAGGRSGREAAMAALLRLLSAADPDAASVLVGDIRESVAADVDLVETISERLDESDLATQLILIQFLGVVGDRRGVLPILAAARDEALREVARATLAAMPDVTGVEIDSAWDRLDCEQRRDACTTLSHVGSDVAIRRLRSALDASDASLRAAAATGLASLGRTEVVPVLVRRLEVAAEDDDFEAEDELEAIIDALVALAGHGDAHAMTRTEEAVELLTAGLDGASEPVRLSIARVLGRIGRPQDEDAVVFLLKDPSAAVRRAAVEALAHLEAGAASEPLRLALADEAGSVRMAAASALAVSRKPGVLEDLRRLIHDEDDRVRAAALRAIGTHGSRSEGAAEWEAVAPILENALMDTGVVAMAAASALRSIGGAPAARLALAIVDRPETEVVQAAVSCVAAHGDTETIEALLPLISHPSWAVRAEAIQALSERRVAKAVPPILRRLETEQDDFVRTAILSALKRLEG